MKFDNPKNYINRDISWLDFNQRVLDEANDEYNPLMEKLKFLSITSSNLDEFFMIRVAGIKEQVKVGFMKKDPSGLSPTEQLSRISDKVHEMISKQYTLYNKHIVSELKNQGILLKDYDQLEGKQKKYIDEYFEDIIFPVLTPLAIDLSRPFPLLSNKAVYIAVSLQVNDVEKFAFIQLPSVFPRIIRVPEGLEKYSYIFSEQIICQNLEKLFVGNIVNNHTLFRLTRNADLLFDEEEAEDLLFEIEKQVKQRKWGSPVRLELQKGCKNNIRNFLVNSFAIDKEDLYYCDGPLDLTCLMPFTGLFSAKPLLSFIPQPQINPYKGLNMFDLIAEKDLMLHFPYHSFDPLLSLLEQASTDPKVLAIKQTLYRISNDSPIVKMLINASRNGKQVTVLVELKARFDEENNISWAKKLENEGCHVIYGLPNLKIHSKMLLIIRKEQSGINRYMHFSTGNYNDKTAKLYTDLGYFTCREDFASDICSLFNYLTGYTEKPVMKKLVTSPSYSRNFFIGKINNEIKNASSGLKGHIIAVMNSLVDTELIEYLYKASCAGVKIELLVRGICCLRPGVKNLSENITVRSIVGRYLEHCRIYYFSNNDNPLYYMGSADIMPRNLDRRVEVLFPIEEKSMKEAIGAVLKQQFDDTLKARFMKSDGVYSYFKERKINSQDSLYEYYANQGK